ncbi:ficolin-1-like [Saccostrea cucullata]|uniref:ficolin-1-like n=1 Tax=Saccostrea cuccullata TaxID=36930 RepID=UPI002ED2D3C1
MSKVILCLYLLYYVRASAQLIATNNFTLYPDLDDKVFTTSLIGEYDAASLGVCSAICGQSCGCFGFNSRTKKCRLHDTCSESSIIAVVEANWRYFLAAAFTGGQSKVDSLAMDCKELCERGHTISGSYLIYPYKNNVSLEVYCDMETADGGWTEQLVLIKNWAAYKTGFGTIQESHWIGNEVIHQLTKGNDSSLYLSITLNNSTTMYEMYQNFSVSDETDKFRLFLGGAATGTLGDSMLNTGSSDKDLSGIAFSTHDSDADLHAGNCADHNKGGWWYNTCHNAFLNGPWNSDTWGRPWYPTIRNGANIAETRMMIRRR